MSSLTQTCFFVQEIQELREQLRDVMFYMEAQQKLSETSEVSQTELQQSHVIVGGGASGTSPSPRSKKGRKKDRWERQGLLHRNYNLFMNDVHYSLHAICKFILRMHLISLHAVCTCKCFTGALHYMLYMNDLLFITCCTHYITWWVSDIHVLNTFGW